MRIKQALTSLKGTSKKRGRAPILAIRAIAAVAMFAAAGIANSMVIADLEDFTNTGGGFFGKVTFEDTATDIVTVTADIAPPINPGLTKGDILGLWLDISDESILGGLSFASVSPVGIVTSTFVDANKVSSNLGGNVNIGGGNPAQTDFDIGIILGANGGPDFVQTLSFTMESTGLLADMFDEQRVGMRVQSIEGDSQFGFGFGSSKLIDEGTSSGTSNGTTSGITGAPEPSSIALIGVGMLGGVLAYRRRKQEAANR